MSLRFAIRVIDFLELIGQLLGLRGRLLAIAMNTNQRFVLGTDRALTAVNKWDSDLSPYNFNVPRADGDERRPVAGAVFTERGIYRAGETVNVQALARDDTARAITGLPLVFVFSRPDGVEFRRSLSPDSSAYQHSQTILEESEIPAFVLATIDAPAINQRPDLALEGSHNCDSSCWHSHYR